MSSRRMLVVYVLTAVALAALAAVFPSWVGITLTSIPQEFNAGRHFILWEPPVDAVVANYYLNWVRMSVEIGLVVAAMLGFLFLPSRFASREGSKPVHTSP